MQSTVSASRLRTPVARCLTVPGTATCFFSSTHLQFRLSLSDRPPQAAYCTGRIRLSYLLHSSSESLVGFKSLFLRPVPDTSPYTHLKEESCESRGDLCATDRQEENEAARPHIGTPKKVLHASATWTRSITRSPRCSASRSALPVSTPIRTIQQYFGLLRYTTDRSTPA
jgi:hypothetical protein